MRNFCLACLVLGLGLGACSRSDQDRAREDTKKAGVAVKKELKNDAAFMKEQALKARAETQQDVKKVKKELNSDSKDADNPKRDDSSSQ